MEIRQGRPDELDVVVEVRREVTEWLKSIGSDQWVNDWPDTATMITGFARDLARGETWFAVDDDQVHAIITINDRTDPGLWTPSEVETALFVHRLTVRRATAGRGLGRQLLDHADHLAASAGRRWLRLDCWTTNTRLHKYYLDQGFRHVRTVPGQSPSGACFERFVERLDEAGNSKDHIDLTG